MQIRSKNQVEGTPFHVDWGNGESYRLLTQQESMGFGVCHTVVRAGTESLLQYRNHLEACYCIEGEGEVEDMNGDVHRIVPGTIYILDEHDRHFLRADADRDMILVSVFNPPLGGTERHDLNNPDGSSY